MAMKWYYLFLVHQVIIIVNAKTLPPQSAIGRTYGNFQPDIEHFSKIFDSSTPKRDLILKGDLIKAGIKFLAGQTKVAEDGLSVSSSHTSKHNGVTHIYIQQHFNGIPVANGFGNINILKNSQVHSISDSFYIGPQPMGNLEPKKSPSDAVRALAKLLRVNSDLNLSEGPLQRASLTQAVTVNGVTFALEGVTTELNYLQTEGSLRLVRRIQVNMKDNYYVACVDTDTNEVISLADHVSDAAYNVLPFGVNDPDNGDRQMVTNPEDFASSPLGWHRSGGIEAFSNTIGNNVIAQENLDGDIQYYNNFRPEGGLPQKFDFPLDQTKHPVDSISASVTQIFYMNNIMHDIFYRYGFDEAAGNFQENNNGLGGVGSDAVIAHTQDGSDINNAHFLALPDGLNGRMRMFLFKPEKEDGTNPRDSTFDSGILIHEYLHGISERLTGGAATTDCLLKSEGGGMGEGWGDIFGIIFQCKKTTASDQMFYVGAYAQNSKTGIRNYPYSTSLSVNPTTYAFTKKSTYRGIHAIGEIWASILNEVYWNLVQKHGFQSDWYKTQASDVEDGKLGGNVIFVQLVIDGMKLQPCNPTFIDARNSILEADKINNNGENLNELWKGFAKRGLGFSATFPGNENFDLPPLQ